MKSNEKKLLVVIHAENRNQTIKNSKVAFDNSADGIFLISHGKLSSHELRTIGIEIYSEAGNRWIGFNFLDANSIYESFILVPEWLHGLWIDDSGIHETESNPVMYAQASLDFRRNVRKTWSGLYFGGVAFKYQPKVKDLARIAKLAVPFMDVITTSGDKTGSPPSVEKIRTIRNAIGKHPLAIASGISAANVRPYLELTDYFLVASSISRSQSDLDPPKVRELANIIHGK